MICIMLLATGITCRGGVAGGCARAGMIYARGRLSCIVVWAALGWLQGTSAGFQLELSGAGKVGKASTCLYK
jgi:hypothetical protein